MDYQEKEETFLESLFAFIGLLMMVGASAFAVIMFWAFTL